MPLFDRANFVLKELETHLPSALSDCDTSAIPLLKWRVTWALGFNLTLGFIAPPEPSNRLEIPANVQRHFKKSNGRTVREIIHQVCFDDLIRSVAAEQRDEWQPDDARPIDREAAEQSFVTLFRRYSEQVTNRVSRRLERSHTGITACVDDAWSRAFECFWSSAATSRYRAAATLVGTISLIALRHARKPPRESQWPVNHDGAEVEIPVDNDPSRSIASMEEAQKMDRRIADLPARQRLIAQLVFRHGMSQADVARKLGTSEANVSLLLKKAREHLQSQKIQISRLSSNP